MMATSPCRSCGSPLVWQATDQGRRPFNADGTPHRDAKGSAPKSAPSSDPSRDREIRRLACLKAASSFCAGRAISNDVGTKDVLAVAAAFERWVLAPETQL